LYEIYKHAFEMQDKTHPGVWRPTITC